MWKRRGLLGLSVDNYLCKWLIWVLLWILFVALFGLFMDSQGLEVVWDHDIADTLFLKEGIEPILSVCQISICVWLMIRFCLLLHTVCRRLSFLHMRMHVESALFQHWRWATHTAFTQSERHRQCETTPHGWQLLHKVRLPLSHRIWGCLFILILLRWRRWLLGDCLLI